MCFLAAGRVDFRKRAREGVGGEFVVVTEGNDGLGLVKLVESQSCMGVWLLLNIEVSTGDQDG